LRILQLLHTLQENLLQFNAIDDLGTGAAATGEDLEVIAIEDIESAAVISSLL
jgi:hypothetical protein